MQYIHTCIHIHKLANAGSSTTHRYSDTDAHTHTHKHTHTHRHTDTNTHTEQSAPAVFPPRKAAYPPYFLANAFSATWTQHWPGSRHRANTGLRVPARHGIRSSTWMSSGRPWHHSLTVCIPGVLPSGDLGRGLGV
jgi:hypothetical protein